MKLSEVGLMEPVLCKHAGTTWSEIVEITKCAYSKNKLAVYIRCESGNRGFTHQWRDVADLDVKFDVFDVVGKHEE